MELRHLRYFKVVAELEHFHNAAEKLCITQPALSNQMRQLEEELATKLFYRVGRRVKLSESGQHVLVTANRMLNEVNLLKETVSEIEQGDRGSLRVGVLQSISALHCKEIVVAFDALHPNINLQFEELANREIENKLIHGDLDVGIGFILNKDYHKDLHFELLFQEDWKLIVSKQNAYFAEKIMNGDTHPLKAVFFPHGFETRAVVENYIQNNAIHTNSVTEVNTISLILDLVESGQSYSILPEAFSRLNSSHTLATFDLEPKLPKRSIGLFSAKDRIRKKTVDNFCQLIREQLSI